MAKAKRVQKGYHAGISGLELPEGVDRFSVGAGVVLRRTYAHMFGSYMMAFRPPAEPGQYHPAPWKATSRHSSFYIHVELFIPEKYSDSKLSHYEVARTIVSLMRLQVDPTIKLLVQSSHPLSDLAEMPDKDILIKPIEVDHQYIRMGYTDKFTPIERMEWVKAHWQSAVALMGSSSDFRLAMAAFEMSTFIPNDALTLISLWGALEALFSPSTSELRFRVSALIAAYLHPPGAVRAKLQKEIFDLYDKRSAAAHGKPKHTSDHLVQTFNILQRVLIRMIACRDVPSKETLHAMLMGNVDKQGRPLQS